MNVETARHPLDFAWLAALRISDAGWRIIRLREVARAFDRSGKPDNQLKAMSVLTEAHVTLTAKIAEDGFHVPGDLEALAIDFAAIGHKAEALSVLSEALNGPLRSRDTFIESIHNPLPSGGEMRVVMLGENASAYLAIGELDLAMPLMQEAWTLTMELCPADKPLGCWAQPLFTALLKSGERAKAWRLARGFKGFEKAEALAAMALYGRRNGYGRKALLEASVAVLVSKRTFMKQLWAYRILKMLAEKNMLGPERKLLKMIKDWDVMAMATIAVAEAYCSMGEIKPAISMLKRAARAAGKIDGGCGHITTWAKLVACYKKLGNRETALEFVEMIRNAADQCTDLQYRCWFNNILIGVYTCVGRREAAEECVDKVLSADLIGLEELNANTHTHPAATLLYDLAMAIAEHGLKFSGERRRKFSQLLASLPEYPEDFPT